MSVVEKVYDAGTPAASVWRSAALDRLRGLAIALMVVDHVLLLAGAPHWSRANLTRAALPLFLLISGHLVRRVGRRTLGIAAVGLVLPAAVPWIDSPNVLVLYALGAVVVAGLRRHQLVLGLVVVAGLTAAANGYVPQGQHFYDPGSVVALMAFGALVPRSAFAAGARLPSWLTLPGRFPLSIYVGHLLVLQLVRSAL